MPGTKGRSGGSKGRLKSDGTIGAGAFIPKLPDLEDEPPLGDDVASIQSHARWAMCQMLSGAMDHAIAKQLTEMHRTLLQAARQRHTEGELDQLKRMLAEAQRLHEGRQQQALADRHAQGTADDDLRMKRSLRRDVNEPPGKGAPLLSVTPNPERAPVPYGNPR